ncbi:MAG: alpha-glycosidase [Oscillospiraceae bacterium]|nr:alpha-glycosidase [Oscillospiraceae bacterium]
MNLNAIIHRSALPDCYALNKDEVVINIRTGKDITAVNLIHEDPYMFGISGDFRWNGKTVPMQVRHELKHCFIWSAVIRPRYKRVQYCFEVFCGKRKMVVMEDDIYPPRMLHKHGRWKQYFKFPWLNASDVISPPAWVADTIWYQIMPERFCRGDDAPKRMKLKKWNDRNHITGWDFFGGDLRGIIDKLPHIRDLGITGIYLLPIFESNSNHKYNTFDYKRIDPDFGTEEDLRELVRTAHDLGIRVMLDAVFNHSGTEFFAWKDVWERGEESPYFDWFCIEERPFRRKRGSLKDGRYYGFAFIDSMPKLNTGNPEVVDYFRKICEYWVTQWNIDGIRFDVGNEVSHSFLKTMNRSLKKLNPDLFLLGEIWMDSIEWLRGDEYDSVMNFPFMESINNFWVDADATSQDLQYGLERVYSLYARQTSRCIFNFMDNHDTLRAINRTGSLDKLYQELTILMTLPGSACVYYGTEIAMPGGHDPDCRRTMPWDEIEAGKHDAAITELKKLIALRKDHPQTRDLEIRWHHNPIHPRLICYDRPGRDGILRVWINGGTESVPLKTVNAVYARKLEGTNLLPGGVLAELV